MPVEPAILVTHVFAFAAYSFPLAVFIGSTEAMLAILKGVSDTGKPAARRRSTGRLGELRGYKLRREVLPCYASYLIFGIPFGIFAIHHHRSTVWPLQPHDIFWLTTKHNAKPSKARSRVAAILPKWHANTPHALPGVRVAIWAASARARWCVSLTRWCSLAN